MPITADKLKAVAMKWVHNDIRIEANAGLREHVSVFRDLGMTDEEIARVVRRGAKKKLDTIIETALDEAGVKKALSTTR